MEASKARQNLHISPEGVALVTSLLQTHPEWNRRRLSQELCRIWGWTNAQGRLRDMACRKLLLKLHRAGEITLPQPQCGCNNDPGRWKFPEVPHARDPIACALRELAPLSIVTADGDEQRLQLVRYLLHRHHYLGYRGSQGENMWYLVYDQAERPLACLTFGAAALKVKSRDSWIGWDAATRKGNLRLLANNQRFLILPWVEVKNLASHVLSRISRRIESDWRDKYGHGVHMLETFVDRSRFRGVCYRAANWTCVGSTAGRTRDDRRHRIEVAVKDIYVYPLSKHFRRELYRGHE